MSASKTVISGPGGRLLEVELDGPEDGDVVVFHHGTPAAGTLYAPRTNDGAQRGLRHLGYSRPGYAGSERDAGRSVASATADLKAVLDALGIDRFFTVGLSGGGPHALACAALLGERVIAAATIGSVAPRGDPELDWLEGMGEENHVEFAAADAGEEPLRELLERLRVELLELRGAQVIAAFGDLLSDVDQRTLTGEFGAFIAQDTLTALTPGAWGWFDDDYAILRDWGFDLGAISRPVTVWQGGQDRFVPFSHGQWLARHVRGAVGQLLPEEGHLSLAVAGYGRVLDDLLARRD